METKFAASRLGVKLSADRKKIILTVDSKERDLSSHPAYIFIVDYYKLLVSGLNEKFRNFFLNNVVRNINKHLEGLDAKEVTYEEVISFLVADSLNNFTSDCYYNRIKEYYFATEELTKVFFNAVVVLSAPKICKSLFENAFPSTDCGVILKLSSELYDDDKSKFFANIKPLFAEYWNKEPSGDILSGSSGGGRDKTQTNDSTKDDDEPGRKRSRKQTLFVSGADSASASSHGNTPQ